MSGSCAISRSTIRHHTLPSYSKGNQKLERPAYLGQHPNRWLHRSSLLQMMARHLPICAQRPPKHSKSRERVRPTPRMLLPQLWLEPDPELPP